MSQTKPQGASEPSEIAGRYQVIKKLGAGAFGTVYKAKDKILGRMIAIKTIRLEGLAAAGASLDELMERFKREAQVSAQLKHPNIVTIYDIGDSDGMSYLAMEFIDGVGLDRVIAGAGRLPLERSSAMGAQIADALDFAHKHGVVHRDIKPANIMIEAGDRVKVTDFGIAKVTTGEHLTMTGSLLGTPSYMSPEQARGGQIDGRSDLFAVGCILYEMVAGQKAFRGDSITGLIFKIITEDPQPLQAIDPDVPPEMVRIITKALAKTPETRYATGRELADDLLGLTRSGAMPTMRQAEMPTAPGVPLGALGAAPSPPTVGGGLPTQVSSAPATQVSSAAPAAAAAPRVAPARRPAAPPPPMPAARRSGAGAGLLVALGLVALLFMGGAAGGFWYLFLRKPAGGGTASLDGGGGATSGATSGGTESPSGDAAAQAASGGDPAAGTQTASGTTGGGTPVGSGDAPGAGTTAATGGVGDSPASTGGRTTAPPPPDRSATQAPAGGPRPRSSEPAATGDPGSAASPDYAFLDEEPAEGPDGTEAGQRLAQSYRSGQERSGGTPFGTGARFRARERSPRSLAVPERPAVAVLRHVINAEEMYYKKNSRYATFTELASARALYMDVPLQAKAFLRKNYRFELAVEEDGFTVLAIPTTPGPRPFIGDDSGFIRVGTE